MNDTNSYISFIFFPIQRKNRVAPIDFMRFSSDIRAIRQVNFTVKFVGTENILYLSWNRRIVNFSNIIMFYKQFPTHAYETYSIYTDY